MEISGFEKMTLTDYPGYVAAIVFTQGCNFKCPFCHNSDLIYFKKGSIDENEILNYLSKRKNVLDGVVITGGEPTMQKDLISFLNKIKDLGLKIKLDTNGAKPESLKKIIELKLVDYIAMDIKSSKENYSKASGVGVDLNKISKSVKLIKESGLDFEFRTTVVKKYHDLADLASICEFIGRDSKYFLQNFEESSGVLNDDLKGFTKDEILKMCSKLNEKYPNAKVRGI